MPSPDPATQVTIIGGGLAGLATAVALAGRGIKLRIIESRPRLGGRASSFTDSTTQELIDNCQHVSMACCTNLADFCRRVGTSDLFRRESQVIFLSPEGKTSILSRGILPAPLHLAESFLRANYLTWSEKLRVGYGLMRLRFVDPTDLDETFAHWLRRHGQTGRTIDRYWSTVLVSALNELPDQMDIGHARKVFIDGFLRNPIGHQIEIPLVPLGELYGTRLEAWLSENDVELSLNTSVRTVRQVSDSHGFEIELRSGQKLPTEILVLATPFDRVTGMIGEDLIDKLPELKSVSGIKSSPITGVHLWFDREVCPYDHLVTIGHLVQWVFNHTAIQRRQPNETGQYLQIVISASYDLLPLDNATILQRVLDDLATIWPDSRNAKLLRSWVLTEHGATFAVRPGVDRLRPPQRTEVPGFFLAGDWTQTGWPATMEGAVRSGYLAAEQILKDLGRPEELLASPLPQGVLARLLLGSQGN